MATIQLPSLNTEGIILLSDDQALESNALAPDLVMSVETDNPTESFGHFRLTVPMSLRNANPALIAEIKNVLTETSAFIESTGDVNLSYLQGRNPLPVEIFDFSSLVSRYVGRRNPDAWGYLEVPGLTRSSQISSAWIGINSNKFKDPDAMRQIRATVAHELFHYYQQLYLPTDGLSQGLLQEASSVWMEFQMMKKYPDFWPKVIDPENVGWFPKDGLLRDDQTACHNPDAHAYATSLFLQYMSDVNGNKAIGNIWQSIKTDDNLLKALSAGFNDPNWHTKWPDFANNLYNGNYTKAMPSSTWSIHINGLYRPSARYAVDDPYTQTKHQFTSNVYPLSAQTHWFTLRYRTKDFNPNENAQLKITNQSSNDMTLFLYRRAANDKDVEFVATIDSKAPFILKDLPSEGKQTYSLVTATKWQPTMATMNQTKEIIIDTEIIFDSDTSVYDALIASLPANNDNHKYTQSSWERYQSLLASCKLKLTSEDSQVLIDQEVIMIQDALAQLEEAAGSPDDYDCGWEPDYTNLTKKLSSGYGEYGYWHIDASTGKLHGLQRVYYDAEMTKPKKALAYYEGEIHGIVTYWHENGKMSNRYEYQHGKLDGSVKSWRENGTLSSEGFYSDGKRNGTFTNWYENGVKSSEGSYLNDRQSGIWTYWNSNGEIHKTVNFG